MYFLIFISLLLATGFVIAFVWAIRSGQYDDKYTPSVRILFDDNLPDGGSAGKSGKPEESDDVGDSEYAVRNVTDSNEIDEPGHRKQNRDVPTSEKRESPANPVPKSADSNGTVKLDHPKHNADTPTSENTRNSTDKTKNQRNHLI